MASPTPEQFGLAEPLMLEKIDKLFACGVGELVDLPQIVVVGDQSSGKSSVLEGLIQKPLPRDSGLCTRFATQIVFRRARQEQIQISIIPDRHASPEHSTRVKAWGRVVSCLDADTFKAIMQEAHKEMGLAGSESTVAEQKPTFSNDVLRLEISGPDQEHLSVIDVPGIFKSTTEGLTTKADIALVRHMVAEYMENPRSVMLAVVPSNVDVATQEILELAAEADADGDRTLGVLTKPDLVDKGAEPGVIDLLEGRTRRMKLGWHVIRNPGQQELQDVTLDRGDLESQFFRSRAPWNGIEKDRVGVDALRLRLKEVLSSLVKREFPKVRVEIKGRLETCRKRLDDLGPGRDSAVEQSAYLTRVATRFQRLVSLALQATHGADDAFEGDPRLRIAPAIMSRMKAFSDEMERYGHTYAFASQGRHQSSGSAAVFITESESEEAKYVVPAQKEFEVRKEEDVDELIDILHSPEGLPLPRRARIEEWLLSIFRTNRGFELGTFNPSLLATCMKKQSTKWTDISMGFVSDVIVLVHGFIEAALASVCPDREVRDALTGKLAEETTRRYQKAIANTQLLLRVENSDTPVTLNHYFNDNLQKSRQKQATSSIKNKAFQNGSNGWVVRLEQATQGTRSMSNEEHVVQDIHDILQSYYKVSRKTFVDNVCKQPVVYDLLQCEESPLALFSPVFVSQLSPVELEELAHEAPGLKRSRAQAAKELSSLTSAMKILAAK